MVLVSGSKDALCIGDSRSCIGECAERMSLGNSGIGETGSAGFVIL